MKLTVEQAYKAMFIFLDRYYDLKEEDALSPLLSDMCLLGNQRPADPAIWDEWMQAVHDAFRDDIDISQKLE